MKQRMDSDDKFFTGFAILSLLGTVAVWCVVIWAIIKLVNHYT